jgi:glycosyltransferase involved in cell wall biosynthesis
VLAFLNPYSFLIWFLSSSEYLLVKRCGSIPLYIRLILSLDILISFTRRYSEEDKNHIRKEYGLRKASTIGIISRLSAVKGHRYLLEAFKKLVSEFSDIQLFIVGAGPSGYRKGLKQLADKLGISDKVVFHEECEDTSIPLSVIDIFCMPSLQEGLGLSILEAMAYGLPVIGSNVGGIYTLIKHGENGLLVPPKDKDAIAQAAKEILSDDNKAQAMAEASRMMVKKKFTLDIMADKVAALYEEIINK